MLDTYIISLTGIQRDTIEKGIGRNIVRHVNHTINNENRIKLKVQFHKWIAIRYQVFINKYKVFIKRFYKFFFITVRSEVFFIKAKSEVFFITNYPWRHWPSPECCRLCMVDGWLKVTHVWSCLTSAVLPGSWMNGKLLSGRPHTLVFLSQTQSPTMLSSLVILHRGSSQR